MAQENRGFLHYFGALPKYWADKGYSLEQFDGLPQFNTPADPTPNIPGCDPAFPPPHNCSFDPNNPVQSFHLVTKCVENTSPFWDPGHYDFNFHDPVSGSATLDGFVHSAAQHARSPNYTDVNGIRAMGYYNGDDLNYYYFMASNFATSDRWFSPAMTGTAANRLYLLAATSVGHVSQLAPGTPTLGNTTIFEALQQAGISWRIYVSDPNPTLIQGSAMSSFSFAFQFPQNFVPAFFEDPKSPGGSVQVGARHASGFINSLMQSASWKDSVFILTWDESGGFYDDVAPQPAVSPDGIRPVDLLLGEPCTWSTGPTCDFVYTGYRVPLIVARRSPRSTTCLIRLRITPRS